MSTTKNFFVRYSSRMGAHRNLIVCGISPSATNDNKGFDVVWTDHVPAGLTYKTGSLACSGYVCTSHSDIDASSPDLTASWGAFPVGSVATVTYQATLDASVPSGTTYTNTAHVAWTSLPGGDPHERTGAGPAPDSYTASDPADVKVNDATPTKAVLTTSETSTTTPDVTIGGFGSNGIAFLFTVIPAASSAFSATLPVRFFFPTSTRKRWLSVPPETSRKPAEATAPARTFAFATTCR